MCIPQISSLFCSLTVYFLDVLAWSSQKHGIQICPISCICLLQQTTLGIQDLGQFYHKPIVGSNGTLVFCTTRHVKSTKVISAMNVKWIPLSKLKEKKSSAIGMEHCIHCINWEEVDNEGWPFLPFHYIAKNIPAWHYVFIIERTYWIKRQLHPSYTVDDEGIHIIIKSVHISFS